MAMIRSKIFATAAGACALLMMLSAASGGAATTAPAKSLSAASTTINASAKPAPAATRSTPKRATTTSAKSSGSSERSAEVSAPAKSDSAMVLHGGQEGTAFRSLTVEGEDHVHYEFPRPDLDVNLDPEKAAGLDRGTAADVLNRNPPDFTTALVAQSATDASPYLAQPWLHEFATGAVARFRPTVDDVESWKLTVVNAKGEPVAAFQGHGKPPAEIAWDGRAASGAPVTPGLTYSYVFEARDRAGNKRNFVGQGFHVAAYHLETPSGPVLAFTGADLANGAATMRGPGGSSEVGAPPVVREAAQWINQAPSTRTPLKVTVTARSRDQATSLAAYLARTMTPLVIGDPARLRMTASVEPDAPESGTIRIEPTH
jgi:hypothetical protein